MDSTVLLRPATENDFEAFWKFASDENVSKYLTWEKYEDRRNAQKFFYEKILKNQELPNAYLMIEYNGIVIGNAHIIARSKFKLQIGIGLVPNYWNKGLGSKSLLELERYIKKHGNNLYYELLADIHQNNEVMRNILIKNNYKFKCAITDNRHAYRKIICCNDHFDYIEWLKSNEIVDAVIGIGTLSKDELADIDIIIICYEESQIEEIISQTKNIDKLVYFEKTSCNHYFFSFSSSKIYDAYFVSVAFINGVNNINKTIFDKSNLISKVLKLENTPNIDNMLKNLLTSTSKLIYKFKNKKYLQSTRILSDIRNKSIIPIGVYMGDLISKNTIDIEWLNKDSETYMAFLSTFVAPNNDDIEKSIKTLLNFIKSLSSNYNSIEFLDEYEELMEHAKEFL